MCGEFSSLDHLVCAPPPSYTGGVPPLLYVRSMALPFVPGTGKTLMARQIGKMLHAREPKVIDGPGKAGDSSTDACSCDVMYRGTEQVCRGV